MVPLRDRPASVRSRLVAFVAIVSALVVASFWAIRVPMFQQPDELAHADYAFALFDVGGPFVTVEPRLTTTAARQTAYLSDAVGYRAMRYNPFARVPPGYGSRSYFDAIDERAPTRSFRAPSPHANLPYVAGLYPIGYYALDAFAMTLAANAAHGSVSLAFFAGRLFNVALLGITLVLSFAVFRRSGLSARESTLATLAVGFFPLVDWVAGYIQPDNLVACLFAAGIAVGLGARKTRDAVVAGLIVSATVLTKAHYAFALWLVLCPLVALRLRISQSRLRSALFVCFDLLLPLAIYRLSVTTLNPVQHLISPGAWAVAAGATSGPNASFAAVAAAAAHAFDDAFFGGIAGLGFWLHFGMRSGSFVPDGAVALARDALVASTIVTIGLFAFVEFGLARRIAAVVRRRSAFCALRLVLAAVPVNAYLVVSFMLIGIAAVTHGGLVLQGRYWLPVVTSLGVLLFAHLPKLARAGPRRRIRLVVTSGAAAYSMSASLVALGAMKANFYVPAERPAIHDSVADVESIRADTSRLADIDDPTIRHDAAIELRGYAVDMRTGRAAREVVLSIDGHDRERERANRPSPRLASTFNDDALARSGFAFRIPAGAVDTGRHVLRFYVSGGGSDRLSFRREIRLRVI